jgi:hypothetical protein
MIGFDRRWRGKANKLHNLHIDIDSDTMFVNIVLLVRTVSFIEPCYFFIIKGTFIVPDRLLPVERGATNLLLAIHVADSHMILESI